MMFGGGRSLAGCEIIVSPDVDSDGDDDDDDDDDDGDHDYVDDGDDDDDAVVLTLDRCLKTSPWSQKRLRQHPGGRKTSKKIYVHRA